MTDAPVRVLGIDPGSARMGYGIIDLDGNDLTVTGYGCVETPADLPAAERLHLLHQDLTTLLDRFAPAEVAIEELFFAKNARTAIAVAQARGVAMLAAAQYGCRVVEYTPLQVKVAVVGYGKAEKIQVQHMVTVLLRLAEPPKPDDTADALAIAICHCHQRGATAGDLGGHASPRRSLPVVVPPAGLRAGAQAPGAALQTPAAGPRS